MINMSLGGGGFSQTSNDLFSEWRQNGALFFAAAGNDGSGGRSNINYPASYEAVLSVAAVNEAGERADFSTFNDFVALAAPGAAVLSTVPEGSGSIAAVSAGDFGVVGGLMEEAQKPPEGGVTGTLIECPDLGEEECPQAGSGPTICLIERCV